MRSEMVTHLPINSWGHLWDVPLADVQIRYSNNLRRTLGTCHPASGVVTISSALMSSPELFEETICHELAHVAVYRKHGPSAKPHGQEWSRMVTAAGFAPRVRHSSAIGPSRRRRRYRYEHRCLVCHSVRVGGRPVPQWHCAECLDAGLTGTMTITRLPIELPRIHD
jgi:predicted SprT family Zn-dependent metalloprotease